MRGRRISATVKMMVRGFFREKVALFFTILFPILLMVLFGFIFQDVDELNVTIHVQDMDDTDMSHNLTDLLSSIDGVTVEKVGKGKDADDYMKDNDINFLVIIPKGYQQSIFTKMTIDPNATVELLVKYDPSVTSTGTKLSLLNSVIQQVNKGMAGAKDTILLDTESIVSEKFEFIDFFIPGLIGFSVMSMSIFSTLNINTEYKQKGILRKLSTTPITRGEWILGNIFFQIIISFLSASIILLVGFGVFGAIPSPSIVLPLMVILEVIAFAGLAMLVTGAIKDAQSAAAVANVIMFPMMFLAGTFFPVEQMPDFLQAIAKVMPLYYVNEGLREGMIFNDTLAAVPHILIVAVFGLIVFIAGMALTSWKQD